VRARTQVRPARERAARKGRARRSLPSVASVGRRRSFADATGSALVEYLVLVGVVALLAIQAFTIFGQDASTTIGKEGADVAKLGF
jgi:hypothetical protein